MIVIIEWFIWLAILIFLIASVYYEKPYYVIYAVNIMIIRLMIPLLDFENKRATTD